jgi:hypothetical protein
MTTDRRNATIAGILLLLGFSGIGIKVALGDLMGGPNILAAIVGRESRVAWAAGFQLFMALSCSGIVVFLYPALKRVDPAWALWSLVLRSFETALFIAAAAGLLALAALGHASVGADPAGAAALGAVCLAVKEFWDLSNGAIAILAWSLGAAIYHVLFFKGRLVPRWLSLWGIVGAPLAVAGCVLAIAGIVPVDSAANTILNLPLGLQEIPLALWLIAKGTRPA